MPVVKEVVQAVGMRVADRRHAKDRDTDRRNDKADRRHQHIASGQLTQVHREDQVSGAKKHTEQRCRDQYFLLYIQSFLHSAFPFFLYFITRLAF